MSEDIQALWQRADSLIDLGRYQEALGPLAMALAKSPEDVDLLFQMARCYLQLDDIKNAEKTNLSSLRIEPNNGWALYLHSLIMRRQLRFDAELELAQQACTLEPEQPYFLQRLAEAQLQSGMTKAAQETAEQLLSLDPNSDVAHEILAELYFDLRRWPQAETHSREALRHSPEDSRLQHWLAEALHQQKKYIEAIEVLTQAVQMDPSSEPRRERLYDMVNAYLGVSSGDGREQKLAALPDVAQMFYTDASRRKTWWQKHSMMIYTAGWVGVGGLVVWLMDAAGIGR